MEQTCKKWLALLALGALCAHLAACAGGGQAQSLALPPTYGSGTFASSYLEGPLGTQAEATGQDAESCPPPANSGKMPEIRLLIDDQTYTAQLYNNAATQKLLELFPLSITMEDLNQNEKFYYLPQNLPTAAEAVESVQAGELMLYGENCLVLFYKGFSTPYSYTRLGYIKNAAAWGKAAGGGTVQAVFNFSC